MFGGRRDDLVVGSSCENFWTPCDVTAIKSNNGNAIALKQQLQLLLDVMLLQFPTAPLNNMCMLFQDPLTILHGARVHLYAVVVVINN